MTGDADEAEPSAREKRVEFSQGAGGRRDVDLSLSRCGERTIEEPASVAAAAVCRVDEESGDLQPPIRLRHRQDDADHRTAFGAGNGSPLGFSGDSCEAAFEPQLGARVRGGEVAEHPSDVVHVFGGEHGMSMRTRSIGLMALTLAPLLRDAGVDPAEAIVIRHAYVTLHENTGSRGLHAKSTDAEVFAYTSNQGVDGFPDVPPRYWVVFIKEGGSEARLWSVVENHGEVGGDGVRREFGIERTNLMSDLAGRLVIRWRAPRSWWIWGATAESYPVSGIADAEPIPFPASTALSSATPSCRR